ncbi:lysine methyltransferase domain-containing protein [Sarocladium implicatum]|nr:lysine methyltransferase domain-containing protein [Sarocladium implicatum]
MHLTSRIRLAEPEGSDPEDIFSSSITALFSDTVANQHGDGQHSLIYTSPQLPRPLVLELAKPVSLEDRQLFSHFLWNASLLLAELVERDSVPHAQDAHVDVDADADADAVEEEAALAGKSLGDGVDFDVRGLNVMELGAGTALPSIMAGLVGARRVLVTDYPAPAFIETLRRNVKNNVLAGCNEPLVTVEGHAWGQVDAATDGVHSGNMHAFDRIFACDCLWMPEQHENLRQSISYFLAKDETCRAWVIAGFHTGRAKMRSFFQESALAAAGLEIDSIWERDCEAKERPWSWDREEEDPAFRRRWLVVASLRRTQTFLHQDDS